MRSLLLSLTFLTMNTVAMAGVTETGSSRDILVDADLGNFTSGSHLQETGSGPVSGLWDELLDVDVAGSGLSAAASSDHNTTINPGHYFGSIANSSSATDPGGFDIVEGYAESDFSVNFTLDSSMDFSISGLLGVGGGSADTAEASVDILNVGVGGSASQSIASGSGAYGVSGTLLPGDYRLDVHTLAYANKGFFEDGSTNVFANASFDMTLTPEPATLALLAMGGLTIVRRRR